jgi:hypothetical protein
LEQVKGVSKGFWHQFKTHEAATEAFQATQRLGDVKVRMSNMETWALNNTVQEKYQKAAAEVGAMATYL